MFEIARKFVKSRPCRRRAGHSVFCYLSFLATVVGQMVHTPPQRKVFGTSLMTTTQQMHRDVSLRRFLGPCRSETATLQFLMPSKIYVHGNEV